MRISFISGMYSNGIKPATQKAGHFMSRTVVHMSKHPYLAIIGGIALAALGALAVFLCVKKYGHASKQEGKKDSATPINEPANEPATQPKDSSSQPPTGEPAKKKKKTEGTKEFDDVVNELKEEQAKNATHSPKKTENPADNATSKEVPPATVISAPETVPAVPVETESEAQGPAKNPALVQDLQKAQAEKAAAEANKQ